MGAKHACIYLLLKRNAAQMPSIARYIHQPEFLMSHIWLPAVDNKTYWLMIIWFLLRWPVEHCSPLQIFLCHAFSHAQ